jgi:protein transport protein SEC24
MTIDDRSYVMQAVVTMPISISVAYTYPRLFSLHDIDSPDTELPTMLRCSIDKFIDDGAYLLGNRKLYIFFMKDINIKVYIYHMFIWLGMALSPQWIQSVFGVPSVVQVDTDRTALPVLDTPLNNRIRNIIDRIRAERHHCMRVSLKI